MPSFRWPELIDFLVSAQQAQDWANNGYPSMVTWDNPGRGHGHVAVIRPGDGEWVGGQFSPAIAQAGRINDNHSDVAHQFGEVVVFE